MSHLNKKSLYNLYTIVNYSIIHIFKQLTIAFKDPIVTNYEQFDIFFTIFCQLRALCWRFSCRCGRNAIVKEKCDVHVSSPTLLRSGKESREEINLQNYVTHHHHKATVDLIKELHTTYIEWNLCKDIFKLAALYMRRLIIHTKDFTDCPRVYMVSPTLELKHLP